MTLAQYLGTKADFAAKKALARLKPRDFFCKKCKSPLVFPLATWDSFFSERCFVTCRLCQRRQKARGSPVASAWDSFFSNSGFWTVNSLWVK
jgi:RNase P subunit RPR2